MIDTAQYHPERCVGCKACTKACPSARNGGIIPNEVIIKINAGKEPDDIWKCLQCHRCSGACPQGIKISEIILEFRSASEPKPERFRKNYETTAKNGRSVARSGMVSKQREQLGLDSCDLSPETIKKVGDALGAKQ